MDYIDRISDKQLQKYVDIFGAVVVEGPKWCGKTRSCKKIAKSTLALADPKLGSQNRDLINLDPEVALQGESPRLIDEWQLVPECWDIIRSQVDLPENKTHYILTGSSTPRNDARLHSGAGRIGRVKMETLTLEELGISNPVVTLNSLLDGTAKIENARPGKLTLDEIIQILCKGGWPQLANVKFENAKIMVSEYYKAITGIEVPDFDSEQISDGNRIKWNPAKMDALFQSLARNAATSAKSTTLLRDLEEYSTDSLSPNTFDQYLNILKQLFLLIDITAWHPALKSDVRLRTTPKRILADPSIAVAALRASEIALKQDIKYVGNLFESLVLKDLIVYARANNATVHYYNDYNDLEVDAIVEGEDRNWGAIEIKIGHMGEEKGIKNLLSLRDKIQTEKQKPPKFLAILSGVGSILHQTEEGVWIIPIDYFGC